MNIVRQEFSTTERRVWAIVIGLAVVIMFSVVKWVISKHAEIAG